MLIRIRKEDCYGCKNFCCDADRQAPLEAGHYYRGDAVYISGEQIEHAGLPDHKLSDYMDQYSSKTTLVRPPMP